MFILSQTNYNHDKLQTSNFMFSCIVVTFVLLNLSSASGKNAKFAKLTGSNLFLLQQVTATSQFVSDQKFFPPNAFCGKIRVRTQRTNYIWNTDPSNLALTKSQIFNDVMVLYISRKKTFIIFLPQNHHLQHFVFDNNEYEWLNNTWKHCSEPPISIKFKTQQKSVTFLFPCTKFLIMINCLYCKNPQELFRYPHNSEWKWSRSAQVPAKSNKSSEIFDQSKMYLGPFPKTVFFFLQEVLTVWFLFWRRDAELQSGKVINKQNIKWNKTSHGNSHV